MYKSFYFILFLFIALVLPSCSKGSLNEIPEPSSEDTSLSEEESMTLSVINAFCNPVEEDDSIVGYQLKIGKVLDESNPTVYSIACDSLSQVHRILYSYFHPLLGENPDYLLPVYDLKSGGKITYCEGKDGNLAQMKIDMPLLPRVKEINFIHSSDWPDNDIFGSPYGVGDVVMDVAGTSFYICVRACSGGMPGLLLGRKKLQQKLVREMDADFNIPINFAKVEIYNALAQLYFNYPNKLCQAIETIWNYKNVTDNLATNYGLWSSDDVVSHLYKSANINNRDYYYSQLPIKFPYGTSWNSKNDVDSYMNEALSYIKKPTKVCALCAEGYESTYTYHVWWAFGIGVKCNKGEYYVYGFDKEMKEGMPVFKKWETISWNKDSKSIRWYHDGCYNFIQKTFTETDKNYKIIDLTDDNN